MKLDRAYQLELLTMLAGEYPLAFDHRKYARTLDGAALYKFGATLTYLGGHGMVDSGLHPGSVDSFIRLPSITEKGLDFLADDGGLSAILGVVTVKLHEADILALIGTRIEKSDLPDPEKKKWIDGIRALPAESIKHLTMKLLDKGLDNWPVALLAIQKFL